MDHAVLFFILLLIWLIPFSFGAVNRENVLDTCLDAQFHKSKPGPESELFNQCKPWKLRSCCTQSTSETLHQPRHHNFNLDHCSEIKNMSSECRRHFIQDSCFYECSPNVGPWIVQVNMKTRNERFYQVPLCQSDCNDWYRDCKHDYTCNGNWFRGWNWTKKGNQCVEGSTCKTFEEVFQNANNFCEKVWDSSWKVTPDEEPCMRIWFNGNKNPNDAVAKYYAQSSNIASSCLPFTLLQYLTIFFIFYHSQ